MISRRSTSDRRGTHAGRLAWDPHAGDRTGPAWSRVIDQLKDGQWHLWTDVVSSVAPGSGLVEKTVSNLIHSGVSNKCLERKGSYSRVKENDTRSVRLINKEPGP